MNRRSVFAKKTRSFSEKHAGISSKEMISLEAYDPDRSDNLKRRVTSREKPERLEREHVTMITGPENPCFTDVPQHKVI